MKKSVLILLLLTCYAMQLQAQEANKFRFDIRLGYAIPSGGGGGVLFNLEPKWTITDNMNVGLRLGAAAYASSLEFNDTTGQGSETEIGANGSYLGTFDYYFHNGSSSFAPFVGGGVGYYQVANVEDDGSDFEDNSEIGTDGKFGGMFRAGFDWGKFRLAAEYNFIGKSDLRNTNNDIIGIAKNGYLGISLGAYFGGGKWGR